MGAGGRGRRGGGGWVVGLVGDQDAKCDRISGRNSLCGAKIIVARASAARGTVPGSRRGLRFEPACCTGRRIRGPCLAAACIEKHDTCPVRDMADTARSMPAAPPPDEPPARRREQPPTPPDPPSFAAGVTTLGAGPHAPLAAEADPASLLHASPSDAALNFLIIPSMRVPLRPMPAPTPPDLIEGTDNLLLPS